jgi:FkbM family methyltransferase
MYEDISSGRMYEPGTWATICAILREGDTFVDVGAHVGTFALLGAALVGDGGWVQAWEPDKQNRRGLFHNLTANYPNRCPVVTVAKCASDHTGERITFHRCADNDGGHAIYDPGLQRGNTKTRQNPRRVMVPVDTLDHHRAQRLSVVKHARLIKIDVEGAECAVLRGAQEIIARQRPAIIAEINHIGLACMGSTESELRELVRRHGYREYAIQDAPPYRVPLTATQTINNEKIVDGQRYLNVYNMLFTPTEWPEL